MIPNLLRRLNLPSVSRAAPRIAACLLAMTALRPLAPAQGALLVKEGKPDSTIVVPKTASRAERFAAEELQRYIKLMSGATLPISAENEAGTLRSRVLIGNVAVAARENRMMQQRGLDSFMVKVAKGIVGGFVGRSWDDRESEWHDLYLVGGSDRGTVYAVYDFLERELGCRWLGPSPLWDEIPKRSTLEIAALNRTEKPAFKYRQESFAASGNWAIKNKCNLGTRIGWSFDWISEKQREYAREKPLFAVPGWSSVHSGPVDLIPGDTDRGGDPKLIRDHPEWFALQANGTRASQWLCDTNPEVIALLSSRLSEMFRTRPHKEYLQLGVGDGLWRGGCQCAACLKVDDAGVSMGEMTQRGIHTRRSLTLGNTVAANLAKTDPGKKLLIGAYNSYQQPPDPAVIKPADNVIIDYYPWEGCRMHGYQHSSREKGDEARHRLHQGWIEGWQRITPGGVIMAEYLERSSMDRMTGSQPRRYVRDMRYLAERGFVGYRSFVHPLSWGLFGINRYAAIKAMWNPLLDADELVRDYCDHAFHAASGAMQEFFTTIETAMEAAPCQNGRATAWMIPSVLQEARNHLDAAHSAAVDDDTVRRRLASIEVHFTFSAKAGPAHERIDAARRTLNSELAREGIRMAQEAHAYLDQMRSKYPDEPFYSILGDRSLEQTRDGSAWQQLAIELEKTKKR